MVLFEKSLWCAYSSAYKIFNEQILIFSEAQLRF